MTTTIADFAAIVIAQMLVNPVALGEIARAMLSGALVGLSLGLVGSGGSVLAVPLLIYFVGIADAHIAIGTSAVAVAANALLASLITPAPERSNGAARRSSLFSASSAPLAARRSERRSTDKSSSRSLASSCFSSAR